MTPPDLLTLLRKDSTVKDWLQGLDEWWDEEPWENLPSAQNQISRHIADECVRMIRKSDPVIFKTNIELAKWLFRHKDSDKHEEAFRVVYSACTMMGHCARQMNIEAGNGSLPEIMWRAAGEPES